MAGRILVTGATGTVGSRVVKELSRSGVMVRAAVHNAAKGDRLRGANVEIFQVDYGRRETLQAAFKDMEKLYLLTPFSPDQLEMARALVDEAKRAGVKHIVKQSGMGADAEPGITVGRLHREAERYIEASGIPYTHLRPNFFMQNFTSYFGESIRSEGKIYLPLGEGRVSYVDARDIAAVAAAVLTGKGHEGRIYNVTGPAALSLHDIADSLSRVLERKVIYVNIPEDAARKGMKGAGMPEWAINCLMELHGVAKAGYASAVTDTVERLTGKKPRTFEEFARENSGYFR